LYIQLKEALRGWIADGRYAAHAKLPAESELSSMFGVSRITVRQALGDLQNEGMIFKVAGKGTFVAKPVAVQELSQLEGFAEAMARGGHEIYNQVSSHRTVQADATVARRLALPAGSAVTEIVRVRHLNRAPLSLELTYLPQAIGERLRRENLAGRDIFLILENDYGIALGRADLQIGAVLSDAAQSEALGIEPGSALLRIERLTHTADGAPLDFEYLFFRGDAFQYQLQLQRQAAR
jgi:GntR family transcriptional regulator